MYTLSSSFLFYFIFFSPRNNKYHPLCYKITYYFIWERLDKVIVIGSFLSPFPNAAVEFPHVLSSDQYPFRAFSMKNVDCCIYNVEIYII